MNEISFKRRKKSLYHFHVQKNQHATSFTNKKSARIKFFEQKSVQNKFQEQNWFHEEKKQCTNLTKERNQLAISFAKRKINIQKSYKQK